MPPAPINKNDTRGYIIPIGGGEDRENEMHIHRKFVELSGGSDAVIVIVPTASKLENTGQYYNELYEQLGVAEVTYLPINNREDCNDPALCELLESATGIFITGGNQLRLSTILGGTMVAQTIRRRNAAGITIAGTSAGASIMSEHMIAGGEGNTNPTADGVNLSPGIGLTNAVIVDQHFTQRNRLGRLLSATSYNPFLIGLGIDEDTAACIGPDNIIEVIGSGTVTVINAENSTYSSMAESRHHKALSLLGLKIDIMAEGCHYDLIKRQAFPPIVDSKDEEE